jgi:hypothetical protein
MTKTWVCIKDIVPGDVFSFSRGGEKVFAYFTIAVSMPRENYRSITCFLIVDDVHRIPIMTYMWHNEDRVFVLS